MTGEEESDSRVLLPAGPLTHKVWQANHLFPSVFVGDVRAPATDTSHLLAHVYVTICVPKSLTSNLGKSVRIWESLSW